MLFGMAEQSVQAQEMMLKRILKNGKMGLNTAGTDTMTEARGDR